MLRAVHACLVSTLLACVSNAPREAQPPTPEPVAAPPEQEGPLVDPLVAPLIAQIARGYAFLGRSDALFWAPFDCLAPPPNPTFVSATQSGEHARKVYHLFLQDPESYASATRSTLPVGTHAREPAFARSVSGTGEERPYDVFRTTEQVLVKESFVPKECPPGEERMGASAAGKRQCPGAPAALFVMVRPRAPRIPTDDGWLYGTYSSGQVTAAGRVASCMGCHLRAPHGRLFGLPAATHSSP